MSIINFNPLVSIIIPCYNHENYIIETLDSILEDTYLSKEIIIIDDGSKDNSVERINNWIFKHNSKISITFKSRENKGLTTTLNELVKLSNGKYLVLLASDDLLINNTISERVKILENNKDKLVLISDAKVIDFNGRIIYESMICDFHKKNKTNYISEDKLLDEILFNFAISGPVLMVNKDIYDLIGKYPDKLKAEDLFFYIKAASANKILFWDYQVSKYRIHTTNTSGLNPALTKTVILTYLKTIWYVPSFFRKVKIIKRILGILFYSNFRIKNR